jgi:hypothetical protein
MVPVSARETMLAFGNDTTARPALEAQAAALTARRDPLCLHAEYRRQSGQEVSCFGSGRPRPHALEGMDHLVYRRPESRRWPGRAG